MFSFAIELMNGSMIKTEVQSHEITGGPRPQDPDGTMLISLPTQEKLRVVKDMEKGTVYLKAYKQFVKMYKIQGTGLYAIRVCAFDLPEMKPLDDTEEPSGAESQSGSNVLKGPEPEFHMEFGEEDRQNERELLEDYNKVHARVWVILNYVRPTS